MCFINSRKVKTQLKCKKRFMQCRRRCCDWSNVSKVICEVSWYCHILAKEFFAVGLSYALEDVEQHPWPLPTRSQ